MHPDINQFQVATLADGVHAKVTMLLAGFPRKLCRALVASIWTIAKVWAYKKSNIWNLFPLYLIF